MSRVSSFTIATSSTDASSEGEFGGSGPALVTPPRAPQAKAFAEQIIGTLRRDCVDHIIVRDERHTEKTPRAYLTYYHGRPHRGLRMQPPDGARHLAPP